MAFQMLATFCLLLSVLCLYSHASPYYSFTTATFDQRLSLRDDGPTFPDNPPSCPICAENYDNINSCALAAPVLANVSMIIFNPGAFINVIECACTDTFQAAYPQCVDCFIQTNQTQYLDPSDGEALPSIVTGMRQVCAIASTLLGGVAYTDGEATPTSTTLPGATGGSLSSSVRSSDVRLITMMGITFGLVL